MRTSAFEIVKHNAMLHFGKAKKITLITYYYVCIIKFAPRTFTFLFEHIPSLPLNYRGFAYSSVPHNVRHDVKLVLCNTTQPYSSSGYKQGRCPPYTILYFYLFVKYNIPQ